MGTRKNLFTLLAASIFLLVACKKESNPNLPPVELKTGDQYQGGIIFSLDASKEHGLIAASLDQSTTASWWNGSFLNIGATDSTNGFGNTTLIINAQGPGNYAAKICRDYRGGQYNDWFLPSKVQLNMLYLQKTLVGGFSGSVYWSSTEYETGEAWVQDFSAGHQHIDNTSDGGNVHARAIRSF